MTGSEHQLNVFLGSQVIAILSLQADKLHFEYTPLWIKTGYALSPHLPLSGEISSHTIERYLRNLFPEGTVFDVLLKSLHLSKSNTFGIIRGLGLDTSGALQFLPISSRLPTKSTFKNIKSHDIEKRLDKHDEYNLIIWDGRPRLSMAGVQDKINITLLKDNQMGFGEGTLCSTHFLKFEKKQLSHLVINEYSSIQLAKHCGLDVPEVKLLRFGKHPALLVKRFDRKLVGNNIVLRKQVIDGCQALNLPPDYKYERNLGSGRDVKHMREGASLMKIFNLAKQCINPALTKLKVLDWVIFNLLINNYDAHGKNISFFVEKQGMILTPFYDLVNIKMYPEFENELAMAIGDDFDGSTIAAYQLADFAENCELPRAYLAKQLNKLASLLLKHLAEAVFYVIAENKEEHDYLKKYQTIVKKRCVYFMKQAKEMTNVIL